MSVADFHQVRLDDHDLEFLDDVFFVQHFLNYILSQFRPVLHVGKDEIKVLEHIMLIIMDQKIEFPHVRS